MAVRKGIYRIYFLKKKANTSSEIAAIHEPMTRIPTRTQCRFVVSGKGGAICSARLEAISCGDE